MIWAYSNGLGMEARLEQLKRDECMVKKLRRILNLPEADERPFYGLRMVFDAIRRRIFSEELQHMEHQRSTVQHVQQNTSSREVFRYWTPACYSTHANLFVQHNKVGK